MRLLGKAALAALVWLTAGMTLIAGVPHFFCRCPDGRVKPFCLGPLSPTTSCCCGGSCCSPAQASEGCCCAHPARPESDGASDSARARDSSCSRVLAQPPILTPSHAKTTIDKDTAFGSFLPAESAHTDSPPLAPHGPTPGQAHLLAPPTDLVILLQHLTI